MRKIIKEGLIPKCGQNCKRVQDSVSCIHVTPSLEDALEYWVCALYKQRDLKGLRILRFNLIGRKYEIISESSLCGNDYAIFEKVIPDDIEYLAYTKNTNICHKNAKKLWLPINEYQLYY